MEHRRFQASGGNRSGVRYLVNLDRGSCPTPLPRLHLTSAEIQVLEILLEFFESHAVDPKSSHMRRFVEGAFVNA